MIPYQDLGLCQFQRWDHARPITSCFFLLMGVPLGPFEDLLRANGIGFDGELFEELMV